MDNIWMELWAIFSFPVILVGCYKTGSYIASIGRVKQVKGLYEPSENEFARLKKRESAANIIWTIIILLLFLAGFFHLLTMK